MNEADQAFTAYQSHGRPEDLARVFDACAPKLLLVANHVAGDGVIAEDLVQMTFLRAIEVADRFDATQPVQPWLVGILVREAKSVRRQERRSPSQERLQVPRTEPIPYEAVESKEFQDTLNAALDDLPKAYREVMTLRLVHGLTPTEIGHLRGVSPETIKTQIRRGIDRLRRLLPPSFAPVMVMLAATGAGLSAAREIVLQVAGSVAEGATVAAATAAATEAALEAGRSAGPEAGTPDAFTPGPAQDFVARPSGSPTSSSATSPLPGPQTLHRVGGVGAPVVAAAVAASGTRRLAWGLGLSAAAALGVWALDPFESGGTPIRPVEHRVEVPDPIKRPKVLRSQKPETEVAEEEAPRVDPSLASFYGRILRASRMGAAGLKVDLLRLHPDVLVVPAAGLPSWTDAADFLVGSTVTNDRGQFDFADVHPAGIFMVVIGAGSEFAKWHLVPRSVRAKERVNLGSFMVGQRRVARGRIVDSQGFGLAGVALREAGLAFEPDPGLGIVGSVLEQVAQDRFERDCAVIIAGEDGPEFFEVPRWFSDWFDAMIGRTVVTDHTGRFEWVDDSRGSKTLIARAAGQRLTRIQFDLSGESTAVGKFRMAPAEMVAGTVWDERGNPLAQAELRVAGWRPGEGSVAGPIVTSGSDGSFHAKWDGGNSMIVAVRRDAQHPWHLVGPMAPSDRVTVALPQRFDLRLRVQRLHGAVRSALEVKPILRLLPGRFRPQRKLGLLTMHQLGCVPEMQFRDEVEPESEAPGRRVLRGVPEGEWTLLVSAKGYSSTAVACNVAGPMEMNVLLRPLAKTDVTVSDPIGRSVFEAPLYAAADEVDRVHEFPVRIGAIGEDGLVGLKRNIERRNLITSVSSEFGVSCSRAISGGNEAGVRFRERGVIYGALTVGGAPADPSWSVLARRAPLRKGELPLGLPIPTVLAKVREDGTFELPPLEPGRWVLRGRQMSQWSEHPAELFNVLFTDAEEIPTATLEVYSRERRSVQFEALPAPEEEAGTEEESQPILPFAGTMVLTPRPGMPAWMGVRLGGAWTWFPLAGDGSFDTGRMLPPGTEVAVQLRNFPAPEGPPPSYLWKGVAEPSSEPFRMTLSLHLSSFTVQTAAGKRAGGLGFVLESEEGSQPVRLLGSTDQSGWFRTHLPAGNYRVQAESLAHGWLDSRRVAVSFSGPHTLQMQPLLAAYGTVDAVALRREIPAGSKVLFTRVGGTTPVRKQVSVAQRTLDFGVTGLLPGTYKVDVLPALRLLSGGIVPGERSGVVLPQGEITVGPGDRRGLKLSRR